ncbi:hypothetical protein JRI60_19390 [Archangium violaceum]|uniref:hypothetical protein n=1 Tax=Archangium violaceum TaxID=83451 RepID=UPI00195215F4|nr:hypothetical protein [Archangium violaceum]QRO01041.1 hypothetical protein JRI60_19390 [Archangium violaceum]
MKSLHAAAGCLGLLLTVTSARAQSAPEPEQAPTRSPRLTLYSQSAALVYLSDARTTGGVGGGLGLRATFQERFFVQAELHYLLGIGNTAALRLGAGVQRRGTYTPAVLLSLSALAGDGLTFLTPQHPTPVKSPAVSLGVSVAPLRFSSGGLHVSALELGVGVGTDLPGTGLALQLGLLEVGTSF